ncbi:MAG: hypothetical protein GAK28_04924 [Luteibacter sp.]|uniref:hypothetical protein n=1 Tax=Luteibacter sp. TaxID=1886636 RepID=UPI00137F94A5|nr:hypothetical protein [Luteibacter sp.]KAF1003123.1 MAG: hypothetical protein GAK28_04924 [Luteibacter sp.]
MPLGTPYIPDTSPHAVGNGQIQNLTASQVSTKYGSGNVRTPTRHFTLQFRGALMQFTANVPFVVTPDLASALVSANAPVV